MSTYPRFFRSRSADRHAIAAIDIGTNSVLMLLTTLRDNGTIDIEQDRAVVTRLGEGVDKNRSLSPVAIERTLSTLQDLATIAKKSGAIIVAVGTSALRDAKNKDAFLEPAKQILGTPIEVISGNKEAELTFLGAIQEVNEVVGPGSNRLSDGEVTVIDVGGGSTEIIQGADGRLRQTTSLDLGAVRLMERYELSAPATTEQVLAINREIQKALEQCDVSLKEPLITVGGTATTLAAILGGVEPFDPRRIHRSRLSRKELGDLCDRLARMSLSERYRIKGLERARADIIVPGALILNAIQNYAKSAHLEVSTGGVRVGLTAETYRKITIDSEGEFA
jgi:exopolyphosphatase / guanosine-5'-triphosphate,3'-diphosphate pyrophosphatase